LYFKEESYIKPRFFDASTTGERVGRLIRHVALLIIALSFSTSDLFSEGTKQLKPDSTKTCDLDCGSGSGTYPCFAHPSCDPDRKLYVRISNNSEKVYLGFAQIFPLPITFRISLNGTVVFGPVSVVQSVGNAGFIQYYSQANFGPNVLSSRGYPPIVFHPGNPGDYSIEFDPVYLEKIDVTVIDTLILPKAAIDGRLWSKSWCISTGSLQTYGAFESTQYILSDDSIVTSVFYNGMLGHHFDVTSTQNGCYPPPEPWDSSCRSRPGNHHYAQYKIFLNNPDSLEFPTGLLGSIISGTATITAACDGSIAATFNVNKSGRVVMNVDVNPLPGMQAEDVTLMDSVTAGTNVMTWMGNDGLGNRVPDGDTVGITLVYVNGLTNLALFDIERHLNGFIISLVRPPGPPIDTYWNDTLLASKGGQLQLAGCHGSYPSSGCHAWQGNYGGVGLGSENTVNTWWYASSSSTFMGWFMVRRTPEAPAGISGPLTVCNNGAGIYSVVPQPFPASDPHGFEWVMTDATGNVVYFDSVAMGDSVVIPFGAYPPGEKRLKVRASSSHCGYGPFGPGTAGEGITILVPEAPSLINQVTTFSLCTGETTNILLQTSIAGSTLEYSAEATSALITGYSGGIQNPIVQTLINPGSEVDSVIYSVVPAYLNCVGDTTRFYVRISQAAMVTNSITSFELCSGETTSITLTSNIPATTFGWTATPGSPSISGFSNSTGTVIQQTLFNTGAIAGTVTYTVTADPGGCSGPPMEFGVTVNPGNPVAVTIAASMSTVCAGTAATFTATAINGGTTPVYQWKVNGINAGFNSPLFTYLPQNNDLVTCSLFSNVACAGNNPAVSNHIGMTVNPVLPVSISITASENPFCFGTQVAFTAHPSNGGANPAYQWKVNGNPAGPNLPVFTYSPSGGDVISCSMISSESCVSGNPAVSNPITMVVNITLPAGITISASANPFCPGTPVTFTAIPVNGGSNPSFQWKVNGTNEGSNAPVFTYQPSDQDNIQCVLTSNLTCVTGNPATSPVVVMSGNLAPVVAFNRCFDSVTTLNAQPIQLRGGLPRGGTYSGPGVNSVTGVFNPASAGTGLKTIVYAYQNVFSCIASRSKTILVLPVQPFSCGSNLTDLRDGRVYRTVQIGSQCWMAANLNTGTQISSGQPQLDNCVAEKYCFNGNAAQCAMYGGLYQWDELMKYDDATSDQGLCPPGWHVPDESEWLALFNFYQGNSRAGRPLQDTLINGFKALRTGVFYLNKSWSYPDFATLLWSSEADGVFRAFSHGMNEWNHSVSLYSSLRSNAFPVRCVYGW